MAPLTRSSRRSARLRGQSAPDPSPRIRSKRIRTNNKTGPRKRARPNCPAHHHPIQRSPHKPSLSLNKPSSSQNTSAFKTKLLDLPDEAISLILLHLGAGDTGGSFAGPRHAFSLAQTNTRLMSMFFSQLTCINPDIANSHSPTLHPTHMFSIILRVRHSLRELSLPKSCHHILQFIHILCPRLEKLKIQDIDEDSGFQPATVLHLKLRMLNIKYPTRNTLRLLPASVPEQLTLTKVSEKHIPDHLTPILRNPPKQFTLETRSLRQEKLRKLVEILEKSCPKIEELIVRVQDHQRGRDQPFLHMVSGFLSVPRPNRESKCKRMTLEGPVWDLIRHAHPDAVIELSGRYQTFVSDGNSIYARKIRLLDMYLTQDLSKVEEVLVEDFCNPQWVELLSDKVFSRVGVTSIETMTYLNLNARAVDLSIKTFVKTMCSNWGWLNGVSEVRLTEQSDLKTRSDKVNFIESVGNLLDQFRGNQVWIRVSFRFRLSIKDSVLRRKVTYLARALDGFEASGGDAGTIRAIVQRIKWR